MTRARIQSRRTVAAGSAILLALMGGTLASPAHAVPVQVGTTIDCPAAYPLDSVTTNTAGTGYTVVTGDTPEAFQVNVLGVLKDGVGAGKDLIMVKISDLSGGHVVDQVGGGWEGMSGSPVYVNGQLLGALSYGFTYGNSPIMGLTPAAYMNSLLGLGAQHRVQANAKVRLSTSARKKLAAAAGTATPRGDLRPIVTPMGVSGLSSRRVDRLQQGLTRAGRSAQLYSAGGRTGADVGTTPTARPAAGGNFAFSISSGDVDYFGVGTTTSVCGDQALAFGHYIDVAGPVSYTAHLASSVAIIKDELGSSYKMANLGAPIGTLDQDRLEAVRADLTRTPDTTTVTTHIDDADTRATRTGITNVSDPASLSYLAPYIVNAGQDAVFDEHGDGVATSGWHITGTRAGGKPFSVARSNSWASRDDITQDPADDLGYALDKIISNDAENVTIDNVTFDSTMKTKYHQRHITFMSVSVNGGHWTTAKRLTLRAGDKLRIHVGMKEYRGVGTKYTLLKMTVPRKAQGQVATLSVTGGNELNDQATSDDGCLFDDGTCGGGSSSTETSLNSIISSITSAPRNDSVVAELSYDSDSTGDTITAAKTTKANTLTVTGERDILVRIG